MPARPSRKLSDNPMTDWGDRPKKEVDEISMVEDFWDYASQSRLGLEQRIKEALHFVAGDQWIRYLPHSRRFTRHAREDWKPTPTTNYLLRTYDRVMDIFLSGDVRPNVEPATEDLDDVDAAMVARRILWSEFERLKTDTKLHLPAISWLLTAGTVFLGAFWDAHSGQRVRRPVMNRYEKEMTAEGVTCPQCGYQAYSELVPERICPECQGQMQEEEVFALDNQGMPIKEMVSEPVLDDKGRKKYREVRMGNIIESVVSPLNFFPGPARKMEDVRTVIEIDPWDIEKVRDIFGSKAGKCVAEDLDYENWGGANANTLSTYFSDQLEKQRHRVIMKFFRTVGDRRWPKGMFKIVANGVLLHSGPLDSTDPNDLGYSMIKYRELPGQFWGGSLFTPLIPIQKRINSIDSHVIQNRKQMVSNQWLVPDGSGVTKTSGRQGLVVRWSPRTSMGYKPERLPGVPVPAQVINEREASIVALEDVGGDKEVLGGDIPPGPETGAAIEALQEQALRRFLPMVKLWRAGLAEHEHRKLKLCDKHWAESRLVKCIGKNKMLEAFYYSRADLFGTKDMTIKVSIGMAHGQAAKRQTLMQAAAQGMLGDITRPKIRGRLLEKLEIEGFEFEYQLDADKARRDLEKLKAGKTLPEPNPLEEPGIFFSVLREFVLTSEFEALPAANQQAIMQRALMYQQMQMQRQQEAMAAAQATKGTGDAVAEDVRATGATGQPVPTG